MSEHHTWRSGVSCGGCRKVSYPSKRAAKAAIRALFRGEKGLTAYRCPAGGTGWHFGHLDMALRERAHRERGRAEPA